MGDLVAPGDDDPGGLVSQQRGKDGRGAAMRRLGGTMDLVQLRVANTAGEKLDQHLIRFGIGERDLIDDQGRVRFDEDGGFRGCRHGFPLCD
jgi:hypothetical protein